MATPEYGILKLDLSTERVAARFAYRGRVMQAIKVGALVNYVDVAFGRANNPRFRFEKALGIHIDFDQFFIWHPAQAGGSIDLMIGSIPDIQLFGIIDQDLASASRMSNTPLSGHVDVAGNGAVKVLDERPGRRQLLMSAGNLGELHVGSRAELNADLASGIFLYTAHDPTPLVNYEGELWARSVAGGKFHFLECY